MALVLLASDGSWEKRLDLIDGDDRDDSGAPVPCRLRVNLPKQAGIEYNQKQWRWAGPANRLLPAAVFYVKVANKGVSGTGKIETG
jgi:hypothetical protein